MRRSMGKARGGGGGSASAGGKYQVGAARNRAAQKEQDDVLSRLPRGPRMDRDPEESPGIGGGFQGYGGERGACTPKESPSSECAAVPVLGYVLDRTGGFQGYGGDRGLWLWRCSILPQ